MSSTSPTSSNPERRVVLTGSGDGELTDLALADDRVAELVGSLGSVRSRIADACEAAGRDSRAVTLVAVTKTYPAQDVATLVRLGMFDIGESKDQEAAAKVAATTQLLAQLSDLAGSPRWHFLGQLQRRKARSVAGYAHTVHSLDRDVLVPLLAEGVERAGRAPLEVFVQVSLDEDPQRGGVALAEVSRLADEVAGNAHLRLRGLMAVAPVDVEPDQAFDTLAHASQRLQFDHPGADAISAGMSGDLEAAIRHGATHVRVGTALLGRRAPNFG